MTIRSPLGLLQLCFRQNVQYFTLEDHIECMLNQSCIPLTQDREMVSLKFHARKHITQGRGKPGWVPTNHREHTHIHYMYVRI